MDTKKEVKTTFISVTTKERYRENETLKARCNAVLKNAHVTSAYTIALYTIDAQVAPKHLAELERRLAHPLTEDTALNQVALHTAPDWAFVVGYLPGVTDNIGKTVRSQLVEISTKKISESATVFSSTLYALRGHCTSDEVHTIARQFYNPVIQYIQILTGDEIAKYVPLAPRVHLSSATTVSIVPLSKLSDEELVVLGKQGIKNTDGTYRGPLALTLPDLSAIKAYFKKIKREPTDVELESIAQTWSEHCKHTIFNDPLDDISEGIYRRYIKGATQKIRALKKKDDICVSVFSDNAGGVRFTDKYLVTHKVETHNSPSALDPFGGAMTGIVGVNRDTLGFGLGAKPIANVYGFCVGHPHDLSVFFRGEGKTNPLLSSQQILSGVVRGVGAGGNESGIPTPVGFVTADSRFRGKPLVFAGTVGLIPRLIKGKPSHVKAARAGDYVVVAGGRVGLDGIHGATFSSEALASGSPATAVQIGDPITQKKLTDAMLCELRDAGLYSSVTDNGAGGISCSVAEMARECGGFVVQLEKVPVKYSGLAPWQVWISESQERMTFSVPPKKWKAFQKIMQKYDVECAHIGQFTKAAQCIVRVRAKKVMNMSMEFLHNGRVPRKQITAIPELGETKQLSHLHTASIPKTALKILGQVGVGSIASVTNQYDHEVQGSSVTKPLQGKGRVNSESAVIQPLRDVQKGVVLSSAIRFSRVPRDAYSFASLAIDEAVRAALASGASLKTISLLDNFCWSSSTLPTRLWELKEATRACFDVAVTYLTPYISGKDSMFNDFRGYTEGGEKIHIAAPPTLLVSAIGHIETITHAQTLDFKTVGDTIYILGDTHDELGGSEYVQALGGMYDCVYEGCALPVVTPQKYLLTYAALERSIEKQLVSAAQPIGKGGFFTALAKMAIAGQYGCDISEALPGTAREPHAQLFSESAGRFIVTVPERSHAAFAKLCAKVPHARIGVVTAKKQIALMDNASASVHLSLHDAAHAYHLTPTV